MKTRPPKKAKPGAVAGNPNYITRTRFTGTGNPRHVRALQELLRGPVPRETLDKRAGCANGPELVAELRRRGLDILCVRVSFVDRDGKLCRPGVYHFTRRDRREVYHWFAATGREVTL
jgi:hypothetical protein